MLTAAKKIPDSSVDVYINPVEYNFTNNFLKVFQAGGTHNWSAHA